MYVGWMVWWAWMPDIMFLTNQERAHKILFCDWPRSYKNKKGMYVGWMVWWAWMPDISAPQQAPRPHHSSSAEKPGHKK